MRENTRSGGLTEGHHKPGTADTVPNSEVSGAATGAEGEVRGTAAPKHAAHIGLRLELSQYPIQGRRTIFKLPVADNREWTRADKFNASSGSDFKQSEVIEQPPSPKKLYVTKPGSCWADLTTVAPLSKAALTAAWRPASDNTSGKPQWFNNYLGASVAIHGERDKTLNASTSTSTSTNNFNELFPPILRCGELSSVSASIATEKMGFLLYVYVLMDLNGKTGIYPIDRGKVADVAITEDEYNIRKRIEREREADGRWGEMPLIPGVQKFHALIAETGTGFELSELYCDGDRIFPE